jgi:hypothetical protein
LTRKEYIQKRKKCRKNLCRNELLLNIVQDTEAIAATTDNNSKDKMSS